MPRIQVRDYRCECGRPIRLPVLPEFTDPFWVEYVKRENEVLRKEFIALSRDFHQFAKEILDAGFESSYMKRCSEMAKLFKELKERYGLE